MRRRRLVLALVATSATAALFACACNVLTGLDADYTLQSGATDADRRGDPDALVPEASASDAASDRNAQRDAADASDSGSATDFCASTDAGTNGFCWDFESAVSPGNWGWTDSAATGGSVEVVAGIGVNRSKALRAKIANASTTSAKAYLHQTIVGSKFTDFRRHEMSFSYSIPQACQLISAALGVLGFGGADNQYVGATIYRAPNVAGFVDLSDPPQAPQGANMPVVLNRWQRVRIMIERRSGTTATYTTTVTVDEQPVHGLLPDFNAGTDASPTQAWVGAFYSTSGAGTVESIIDNVLVTQSN